MSEPTTLTLRGDATYDVVVGHDVADRLPGLLGDGVRRVAVIHPVSLADRARSLRRTLDDAGYAAHGLEVPDGEAAKSADVAAFCWSVLGQAGFTRSDAVVTLGGGATTDLGGFVAATWLRGVRVVHLPTTLLAMVDAAVGGKTGINSAEGKNLVGSFHHPAGVLCDLRTLETLPRNELVSGMAEVAKCGFIADPEILAILERSPATAMTVGSAEQRELVERAIQVKLDVVAGDFKETAGTAGAGATGGHPGREALNYGHTLGHAIERAEHYRYRHGAAISIGMVYVAELARLAGRLDDDTAARHAHLLASLGLPTTYDGARWDELLASMRVDKKSRGDLLRFVVIEGIGRPALLEGPDPALLEQAFAAVRPREGS